MDERNIYSLKSLVVVDDADMGKLSTTVGIGDKKADTKNPLELGAKEEGTNTVVDTVSYENLQPGEIYTLTGKLVDITDVKGDEGGTLIKEESLDNQEVGKDGMGTWEMTFKDVNLQAGRTYVVYETATSKENLTQKNGAPTPVVIEHKDNKDAAQTVVMKAKESTETPDNPAPDPKPEPEAIVKKDVTVSKISLAEDNETIIKVVGAVIQIYQGEDISGKKIDGWVTEKDQDYVLRGLEVDKKYTFHEAAAPKGLEVVTDFVFSVDKEGKVSVHSTITNGKVEYKDGKLIVTDDKADVSKKQNDNQSKKLQKSQQGPNSSGSTGKSVHKTGDSRVLWLYGVMLTVSGLVLLAIVWTRKKNHNNGEA